ncbi:methyl-accepting chemotaxis protein [Zooshikella harenae]|uniref:Methyl-accepting chemotaxis protein n=1 Tax=Zooshikella harenae TaxID=2827238 RepID=A0ABS5ZCZ0_9GAMM|nr:PAS domain-containing methyl-accepting chemotaxis protein [Zooshikella harenae]MBU2711196.1 methyl-accepting chemotaxis protein [Zooshikella harenae]
MNQKSSFTIDEEVTFDSSEELVSTTDTRGKITYANKSFCRVSGYSLEELVGKPHNLVRHPDMPKVTFKDLWDKLKAEKPWRGLVKNRCKDGRYYWVDAFVTPIYENNQLIGYQSVRSQPTAQHVATAEKLYARLNHGSTLSHWYNTPQIKYALLAISWLVTGFITYNLSLPWLQVCISLILPFIIFKHELFTTPAFLYKIQQQYDSVSRFVFSGNKPHAIADFHLKLYEGKVKTILSRVQDSMRTMQELIESLLSAAQSAQEGSETETKELHQLATATDQMAATISEVAKNTEQTAEKTHQAHDDCDQTNHAMAKTAKLINQLAQEVESSADASKELANKAEKVSHIMSEIQGIADQTNLLALNAAIEAARAGEQGRGFAVVAEEVRALSQRTQSATEQIQSSIQDIQDTLLSWATKMNSEKENAQHCVEDAVNTQERVHSIYQLITDITELTTQISAAAEEQSVVSQEISQNINKISHASQSNLDQATIVQKQAHSLEEKTNKLSMLTKAFD